MINFTFLEAEAVRKTIWALGILIAGGVLAIIVGKLLEIPFKKMGIVRRKKVSASVKSFIKATQFVIIVLAIIVALSELNVTAAQQTVDGLVAALPKAITAILILFLGFVFVNLIIDLTAVIFTTVKFRQRLSEMGISREIFDAILLIVKVFLYLIVLNISLSSFGIAGAIMNSLIIAIIITFLVIIAALSVFAFKDVLLNIALSYYLKRILKPGQTIKVGEEIGEILDISSYGILVKTDKPYNLLVPLKTFIKETTKFKRTNIEIESLEKIRAKYVAQKASYCGPASLQMILSFFGINRTQDEIARASETKVPGGVDPDRLISAVEKLTQNKIKGAFVPFGEVYNLKEEIRSWIADGALVLLLFKKKVLFPHARTGHYVVCVGVEGDDLIIIDPSKDGGVYLVNYKTMEEGISSYDKEGKERGYLVFAPKATPAYWRIANKLLYVNVELYKKIGKVFERELNKLRRKARSFESILSSSVQHSMEGEEIEWVWRPEKK